MINSLPQLIKNATFQKLMKRQAILDDSDKMLHDSPMTRSPYHLIALLISWKMTIPSDQNFVVDKLNAFLQSTTLYAEELNTLADTIDWRAIFSELNSAENKCLKFTLPESVLSWIEAQGEAFFLSKVPNYKEMLTKGSDQQIIINTTIHHKFEWMDEFEERYLPSDQGRIPSLWYVPQNTFKLSNQCNQILNSTKKKMLQNGEEESTEEYGAFMISTEKHKIRSFDPLHDVTELYILTNHQTKLAASLEKAKMSPGLYDAFIGVEFYGMPIKIGEVIVKLSGHTSLDKRGAEITQEQEVDFTAGCGAPGSEKEYVFFKHTITIKDVYALFNESLIGVNFSQSTNTHLTDTDPNLTITLFGKKREAKVTLFPSVISHQIINHWAGSESSFSSAPISLTTSGLSFWEGSESRYSSIEEPIVGPQQSCCNIL